MVYSSFSHHNFEAKITAFILQKEKWRTGDTDTHTSKKENVSPLVASVISTGAWKYNPSSPRAPVQSLDRGQDGIPKQGATEMPGARKCSPAYLLPSQSFWASSIASSEFVNIRHESTLQNQKNFIHLPCYLYKGQQQICPYKQLFKKGSRI